MPRHPDWYRRMTASVAWADRKLAYYRRHPRRCAACFKRGKNIQLHHKQYQGVVDGTVIILQRPEHWGKEPDDWLAPLCGRCHTNVHAIEKAGKFPTLAEATDWYIDRMNRRKARHRRYEKLPLIGWMWR